MIDPKYQAMTMIAAVDENYGIGKDGDLLYRTKADMDFFRSKTEYHTVVMGYNTYLSLPKRKPLENRFNVILSRTHSEPPGFKVMRSLDELIHSVNPYDTYVIGGESIYRILLPYSNFIWLTRYIGAYKLEADKFFPNVDILVKSGDWELDYRSQWQMDINKIDGSHVNLNMSRYVRRNIEET